MTSTASLSEALTERILTEVFPRSYVTPEEKKLLTLLLEAAILEGRKEGGSGDGK